jgi:cobalamin biosynthesis Co2+ chelatase CbiK
MYHLLTHHTGTEAQWSALLEESGFKIVQIYSHGLGAESVIEAELV